MIKRLALLFCILLLPSIAAAEGNPYNGDFWVGGQIGGVFTDPRNVNVEGPGFNFTSTNSIKTGGAIGSGGIVGYNFPMPSTQTWERYLGVALDF